MMSRIQPTVNCNTLILNFHSGKCLKGFICCQLDIPLRKNKQLIKKKTKQQHPCPAPEAEQDQIQAIFTAGVDIHTKTDVHAHLRL